MGLGTTRIIRVLRKSKMYLMRKIERVCFNKEKRSRFVLHSWELFNTQAMPIKRGLHNIVCHTCFYSRTS